MSLILEALKKSEQQRRLGEMPNLGTPVTATRRRRSPLPWLAVAIVLALGAAGGWRYLRQHATQAPVAAAGDPATVKAATNTATDPTAASTPRPAPPKPVTSVAQTAPATTLAAPSKKEPANPASAQTAMRAPAPPAAPVATPVPAPLPPAPATATPTPAPAITPPPAPAAAAPAPAANDVPTVDEMPADVRGALPALPITMQVYSPDPKRRFAIIEGTRVTEGESVRGVTVVEIRPSGLVLEFHGRRMLMPRPGS